MTDMIMSAQSMIDALWVSQITDRNTILHSPSTYFYILWLLIILYWVLAILRTMKDITARTTSILWQIFAVLLVGIWTPFIWLPLYFFLRPMRYNWDRLWWREALSVQVASCPACAKKNPLHHEFCVYCSQQMMVKCKECKSSYQRSYDYCPQCWAANIE